MKKITPVFLSFVFLFVLFVGSALCESPTMNDSEPVISQEESEDGESILDLLVPDEAEAAPLERDTGDAYDEDLHKGDDLRFLESGKEDYKAHEEEDEKEKTIL